MGRAVTEQEFIEICLMLQEAGAENINIVTGSHAVPALGAGLRAAKRHDLKTLNTETSRRVFAAPDYPEQACTAIETMARLSPLIITPPDERYPFGKMLSGVIVRHLALPGKLEDSQAVLRWFAQKLKGKALLSLMTQYTPITANPKARHIDVFSNRLLNESEDLTLRTFLEDLNIDDGFYQELVSDLDWLPDFNRVQTFSSTLSKPLWHWKTGRLN